MDSEAPSLQALIESWVCFLERSFKARFGTMDSEAPGLWSLGELLQLIDQQEA